MYACAAALKLLNLQPEILHIGTENRTTPVAQYTYITKSETGQGQRKKKFLALYIIKPQDNPK